MARDTPNTPFTRWPPPPNSTKPPASSMRFCSSGSAGSCAFVRMRPGTGSGMLPLYIWAVTSQSPEMTPWESPMLPSTASSASGESSTTQAVQPERFCSPILSLYRMKSWSRLSRASRRASAAILSTSSSVFGAPRPAASLSCSTFRNILRTSCGRKRAANFAQDLPPCPSKTPRRRQLRPPGRRLHFSREWQYLSCISTRLPRETATRTTAFSLVFLFTTFRIERDRSASLIITAVATAPMPRKVSVTMGRGMDGMLTPSLSASMSLSTSSRFARSSRGSSMLWMTLTMGGTASRPFFFTKLRSSSPVACSP
mmetsp:Transcript_39386/g.116792  ORF Transcript_39386/g.116792 Transcript_39386/m.116792 type:complete len:313 (+) Transcript_39386:380-1318(+)